MSRERMDPHIAVFNGHVHNASDRADAEFKALFGSKRFDRHIAPRREEGIMSIFEHENKWTLLWIVLCTAFVNEDRRNPYNSIAKQLPIG